MARRNPLSVGGGTSGGVIPTLLPFMRVKGLEEFYSNRKGAASLTKEELPRKSMSEDMKAHWAIEQWINAAKHLGVMDIVSGKEAIPTIAPIDDYCKAHFMVNQMTYDSLEAVAERKSVIVERDTRVYNKIYDLKEEEWNEQLEGRSRIQALIEIDKDLKKVEEECIDARRKMAEMKGEALKAAAKQRNEDVEALQNLREALENLKKYLWELMRKVPSIERAVRWKGKDGASIDPYEYWSARESVE